MDNRNELQKLMDDISEWSDNTFGLDQRNPAIAYHLKKEIDELIWAIKAHQNGNKPSVSVKGDMLVERVFLEYADCFMLLLDSATHLGLSANDLIAYSRIKLEINKARKWGVPDENGVVEHIKESEQRQVTDEEIEEYANGLANASSKKDFERGEWLGVKEGAKWMRDKLKTK